MTGWTNYGKINVYEYILPTQSFTFSTHSSGQEFCAGIVLVSAEDALSDLFLKQRYFKQTLG